MYNTLQEVVDTVVKGLRAQGFQRSMSDDQNESEQYCMYRGANGRKCAIGHLISDANYTPVIEGSALGVLLNKYDGSDWLQNTLGPVASDPRCVELLSRLQSAHDLHHIPDMMVKDIKKVCADFNLIYPE